MPRILRYCIISIFLCAAFSSRAQEAADWALKAVECERTAFSAEDPRDAADALAQKAFCLRQCGRYGEAAATLSRISLYLLEPERREDVMYERELCSYLAGDYAAAASHMEEAGEAGTPRRLALDALVLAGCSRWEESRSRAEELLRLRYDGAELDAALEGLDDIFSRVPGMKKEGTAMLLSFLPPLGHLYTGHVAEGLVSMGLNAASAGWIVWQCLGGDWVTGILGGGIALEAAFMGGMNRSVQLVEEYNRDALAGFGGVLRDFLMSHEGAE